ncbi:alcohol oxidase [Trametes punicea]|nr:alcohol oxidase [Trametes punicea]
MTATIDDVKGKSYDYILCGGGTAGLVLAARLTENPDVSVLVLEAGDANIGHMERLLPASYMGQLGKPQYTWSHRTTNQKNSDGHAYMWYRGKGLGGSSGANFYCWVKPPASEMDDLERLGNPGWNWKNYEKYVRRTEGFVPPSEKMQKALKMNLDGWDMEIDGPLTLSFPATIDEGERKIQETFIHAGIPPAARPMNGDPVGTFFAPLTYDPKTHTRTYSATAFYLPNKDRPNLTVLVSAHVTRVLPSSDSDFEFKAHSVEFQHDGQLYTVHANREIILSAGALKTPQILELSGIGDPAILREIGIPTKVELPTVGTNVQEHMTVPVSFEIRDDVAFETLDILADPEELQRQLALHANGTGAFTTGITGLTFAKLAQVSPRAEEIIKAAEDKIMRNAHKYPPGLLKQHKILLDRLRHGAGCEYAAVAGMVSQPNPPVKGKRYISFWVAVNYNFSRGTIHAVSNDPAEDPAFDPHYLEEEVDLQVWIEMMKFIRNLPSYPPLKDMITKELNPGPEVQTDEQIAAYIKKYLWTTHHTAGSCSMLPRADGGVVDPELKVYGTKNLRVVDLSILPLQLAVHPQSVVYGMAEQGTSFGYSRTVLII